MTTSRFVRVQAVQPAGILGEHSAPGNRHGQEQGIEPCIIEALAEITTRRHQHPFLAVRNCRQGFGCRPRLPSAHAAAENDDILRELRQTARPAVEMILALGDDHRRATGFERRQDVVEDQIIPRRVLSELCVKFLDCRLFIWTDFEEAETRCAGKRPCGRRAERPPASWHRHDDEPGRIA